MKLFSTTASAVMATSSAYRRAIAHLPLFPVVLASRTSPAGCHWACFLRRTPTSPHALRRSNSKPFPDAAPAQQDSASKYYLKGVSHGLCSPANFDDHRNRTRRQFHAQSR